MPSPADPDGATHAGRGLSPRLVEWLLAEPLGDLVALDVGTGRGPLALLLAAHCRRVVGIDRDAAAIEEARCRARSAGLSNVEFVIADAETVEYGAWAPDLVVAHLCMSNAIVERAAHALAPGRVLAFVAFHADQWIETGRRSRFAFDEDEMRAVLQRCGFAVERLEIDREVRTFRSVEEALAAVVGLAERWRQDGRWFRYIQYLEEGGRSLTISHLVVKARRR